MPNAPTVLTMVYNTIGNVTSRSDVGAYTYPASGTGSVRPHAVTTAAGGAYVHDDHLGSTDVITNQAFSVVVRLSFDDWGKRRGSA